MLDAQTGCVLLINLRCTGAKIAQLVQVPLVFVLRVDDLGSFFISFFVALL